MPILPRKPEPEETATSTIRLSKDMIQRLDDIADSKGYSRNEVIGLFLQWGIQQFELEEKAEQEAGEPSKKRK